MPSNGYHYILYVSSFDDVSKHGHEQFRENNKTTARISSNGIEVRRYMYLGIQTKASFGLSRLPAKPAVH